MAMDSNDAIKSAEKLSQVSPKKQKRRTHFYWLGGGALASLLVLLLSVDNSQTQQKTPETTINRDYRSSLNANLARLQVMQKAKPTIPTILNGTTQQPLIQPSISKKYLARQNAPTSMYSATFQDITGRHTSPLVQKATFAGQGSNENFGNSQLTTTTVEAKKIPHPDFTIASGEFLHAVLETVINSDLPGMVRAILSKPVYAYTGERLLLPAGSRLIGQYTSNLIQGQHRIMVIWNRIILPNGIAVQINSPGTDALGRAGQGANRVDTHFLARFGQSALLSLIGAGTATVGVKDQDQYNLAAQYRMAIAQSFQQSANQSLQGSLPMKPTLHIVQGALINVFVAHDLSFYQVLKHAAELPGPAWR